MAKKYDRGWNNDDEKMLTELYRRNKKYIRKKANETAEKYSKLIGYNDRLKDSKIINRDLYQIASLVFCQRLIKRMYKVGEVRYLTYITPVMIGKMKEYIRINSSFVSMSNEPFYNILKTKHMAFVSWMTDEEIAAELDVSISAVKKYREFQFGYVSLIIEFSDDPKKRAEEIGCITEEIVRAHSTPPDRIVYRRICSELLRELCSVLPRLDRDILFMSYGVFGHEELTDRDISDLMLMDAKTVRKVRDRALQVLREKYSGSRYQIFKMLWKRLDEACREGYRIRYIDDEDDEESPDDPEVSDNNNTRL